MPKAPQFDYFLSNSNFPVKPSLPIWRSTLPMSRQQSGGTYREQTTGSAITYAEYFSAAHAFIVENRSGCIVRAVSMMLGRHVDTDELKAFSIFLEKHGALYHPSRVLILVGPQRLSFVLNVAVSEAGKAYLNQEYDNLLRLETMVEHAFVPRVFGRGEVAVSASRKVSLFLGEWFEGYHELHVSEKDVPGASRIRVWDPENGSLFLSKKQAQGFYEQVSAILTAYYNLETFEQIFSWHHAAGDFVIKITSQGIQVKLVTVRQYSPLFKSAETEIGLVLHALLLFLLNVSIRMRLDRIDGVGEMVWADTPAVVGTLVGFFKGLRVKARTGTIPDSFVDSFKTYLKQISRNDLLELLKAMLNRWDKSSPDTLLAKQFLKTHADDIKHTIDQHL
jgi:hypothetical protein